LNNLSQQVLPKPPRLLPDGSGYDWREFDRWMQRVFSLLGLPQKNSASLNLIAAAQESINQSVDSGANFALDHQWEIKTLERRLENVIVEMNMIIDNKQQIQKLLQLVQNIQVSQSMGV
jgi:hypothetical protein